MSSLRTPHGSSNTRSSQVRIQPCSGDCALVRSRRSISLAMKLWAASGDIERLQPGAVLADDVVVVLAQLLADRGQLLAQQVLALLAVDALGDVVADRLGDLQLGEMLAGPRRGRARRGRPRGSRPSTSRRRSSSRSAHVTTAVGERTRFRRRAQQLGQPARAAQLGDRLEHDAQLAGEGLDAGRRPRVADDLDVGVGRAALATRGRR